MASDFSQYFQQALLTLAGAIVQQQSVSVGSNISGTSGQSVLVAFTAVLGSLISINAVNTTSVSSPASMGITRTSTSTGMYRSKTQGHTFIVNTSSIFCAHPHVYM